jgi:2-dehydro-3-deoxygluconokinase
LKSLDVVTFGETMVLFQPDAQLPLEYVHRFQKQIGGAESNMAIGLQRLGHRVGWFSKLGSDPFGRYVLQTIRGEGVDTSACLFTDEALTSVFFKEMRSSDAINVFYYRKNGSASLLKPEDLDEAYISSAKILHLTGITPALSDSCLETVFAAITIAKQHGLKIVFDPNIRLKLWEKEKAKTVLKEIASYADVILPGLDEGELITGKTTPEEIASSFIQRDNQTVIIKLGSKGAFYQTAYESGYVEGFKVDHVVDPVGAGDGFAAGIISGLLRNDSLQETVRKANAIGAMVVGVNGDMEGLPRLKEVESFMNQTSEKRDVIR